jgi:molybdopterin/thiamine biosynthesis adenylyltransferase
MLAGVFRLRTGSDVYASAIFSLSNQGLSFSGRVETEGGASKIEHLIELDARLRLTQAIDAEGGRIDPIFERQVAAFGSAVQETLGCLNVAVVGCGGTGSAVAEQLVRLGVRSLTLIDADTLTESNVTRVYGSTPADVGKLKVEILRNHLQSISPMLSCTAIPGMITNRSVAENLIACDVVFGCTDDNAGRLVLSRMPTYLGSLVIDCGVLLSSDKQGRLTGINGRVTVLTPGSACLLCRGRIDVRRAATELMTPDERRRLQDEGYAPALGSAEPAVVAYTTAVAAAAVAELLERLVGYGPDPVPGELLLRLHEREWSTNHATPRAGHYCDPSARKINRGSASPFLEQVWST